MRGAVEHSNAVFRGGRMEGAMEFEADPLRHRLRGEAREQPQHPYGVGRFVDAAAWMGNGPPRINRADTVPKYRGSGSEGAAPTAMARRNERERKRVRLVNHGFATLRQYLPQGNSRKKLSKMETLRSAIEYIKQLQYLLDPPQEYPAQDVHSAARQWKVDSDGQLGRSHEQLVSRILPTDKSQSGSRPHTLFLIFLVFQMLLKEKKEKKMLRGPCVGVPRCTAPSFNRPSHTCEYLKDNGKGPPVVIDEREGFRWLG